MWQFHTPSWSCSSLVCVHWTQHQMCQSPHLRKGRQCSHPLPPDELRPNTRTCNSVSTYAWYANNFSDSPLLAYMQHRPNAPNATLQNAAAATLHFVKASKGLNGSLQNASAATLLFVKASNRPKATLQNVWAATLYFVKLNASNNNNDNNT